VRSSGGTTVSFKGNFIEGTIGGGLSASCAFGDLTISNNEISGYSDVLAGIHLSNCFGYDAAASSLSITGNKVSSTISGATGIKIDGIPPAEITSLSNNNLQDNDLTIDINGEGTLTIPGNWHVASGVAGLNASVSEGVEITSALVSNGDDAAQTGFQPTRNWATIGGCNISTACNFVDALPFPDATDCEYTSCAGCTDASTCHYDATATISDGSCNYLIFSGYTNIETASSATAIDAMIQPVIGGTGGSGTYALATEDGQVFWFAMWGMMTSGRWEFKMMRGVNLLNLGTL
jgi:hypothetical protein